MRRVNRFLGEVEFSGNPALEFVHVHDPGRLEELLYPGNEVLIRPASTRKHRKTRFDLIAAKFEPYWVLIHSAYHRYISEWVIRQPDLLPFTDILSIRPEVTLGDSRIDFVIDRREQRPVAVEVKGCSLARAGTALFPDAPTQRGTRHVANLLRLTQSGSMDACIMILVFRPDATRFTANRETDPDFADTLDQALKAGIPVQPVVFGFDGRTLFCHGTIRALCSA